MKITKTTLMLSRMEQLKFCKGNHTSIGEVIDRDGTCTIDGVTGITFAECELKDGTVAIATILSTENNGTYLSTSVVVRSVFEEIADGIADESIKIEELKSSIFTFEKTKNEKGQPVTIVNF